MAVGRDPFVLSDDSAESRSQLTNDGHAPGERENSDERARLQLLEAIAHTLRELEPPALD